MTVFDPVLLRSFLTVADTLGFTAAGKRLDLTQSTVSGHVRKLEAALGRRLFVRDTHQVRLTPDGEAMVGFARTAVEAEERALRFFASSRLRGRLRFGASEDLVLHGLPIILREFRRDHPMVDLELVVGVSGALHEHLAAGRLDLVFAKRPPGDTRGRLVWRDRLVWFGEAEAAERAPLPLILLNPPSITRARAIEALEKAGRAWRVACTSDSQSGVHAAALAGLGIGAHAKSLLPAGLQPTPRSRRLPDLGEIEFVISSGAREPVGAAAALGDVIRSTHHRLLSAGA